MSTLEHAPEISPIRVGLKFRAELLDALLQSLVKVVLIHIAHGHKTATLIADKMQIAHSDSAHSDYSARELIARSDVLLVARPWRPNTLRGRIVNNASPAADFFKKLLLDSPIVLL